MGHLDRTLATLQCFPGLDLAEKHLDELVLGETQGGAVSLVEGHGNRAADGGELHHTASNLGDFGRLDRFIGGTEIDSAGHELAHPGPGAH